MDRATFGLRRALAVLTVGLAILACVSPTLPLPPPAIPSFSSQGVPVGEVELQSVGGAEANAVIVIYNQNPTVPLDKRVGGAQADGKGSWDAVITGSTGDFLEITQQSGTSVSPSTTVQIPAL
jgi:hypothetical protein